ncbi:flavin reductase family protein [bacterium]|nr:flavin reductase family protein [bacterium]MBU1921533.1 flavin reductase family protein [bacterium]
MTKISHPPYVHSFPAPAVLIGCGTLEHPNLITCSWFGTVCSEPPLVSVSVRKSRFSHHLIAEHREFTVNLPRIHDLDAVKHCGATSGRVVNKFDDLKLTPVVCPSLKHAPMIAEFFHVLGCRVRHIIELGSHDMFVAEVVSIHCSEEDRRSAKPDPHCEEQIVYLDGKYWSLKPMVDHS